MITSLRSSTYRLAAGAILAVLALGVFAFALPDAAQKREKAEKAAREAAAALARQKEELQAYQDEAERLRADRKALDELLRTMPSEPVGRLHWKLSQVLYDLARKHQVRLVSVKYGAPSREGAKGSLLEALDVEFSVVGVFQNLKPFMLALEGSRLPFAVASAKLDESPEGGHLTVVLRAFRQAPGAAAAEPGEGA
ncbi:hypothetical protein [Mesoterricola sediminis]|uniref:Uncharacterized protein n=1 Tax=Mesoterricola sediminis TaxID=2927980 RepID=A0AA48KDT8_9BACT|nr:hypothetical protein [Mesoterricola sediminis]BDU76672.1 hypothetical protein METESE_16300 [Mesoterricola sediminis]